MKLSRRRIFANAICDKIIAILDNPESTLDFVTSVSKGDLSLLPEPDSFKEFMPAIIIDIDSINNIAATYSKSIISSEYYFNIRYLKYYDTELTYVIKQQAIDEAEKIADVLLDEGNFQLDSKDPVIRNKCLITDIDTSKIFGHILNASLPNILINSAETLIFKNLELPVIVVEMDYIVQFRTLSKDPMARLGNRSEITSSAMVAG